MHIDILIQDLIRKLKKRHDGITVKHTHATNQQYKASLEKELYTIETLIVAMETYQVNTMPF